MLKIDLKSAVKTIQIGFLLAIIIAASCKKDDNTAPLDPGIPPGIDYKNEMRNFVIGISGYSKSIHPGFIIIPQNGQELVTADGKSNGPIATNYMNAIDGQGREDLFYGYTADDTPTDADVQNYLTGFLDRLKQAGKAVLVTDYCNTPSKMTDSYAQNNSNGYISFAADHRELDDLPGFPPAVYNQNTGNINNLAGARNFLYLINPSTYTKDQFIAAVNNTNYDLVIMDLFINEEPFTAAETESLKQKKDGGKRLVICYMSIGEAEDYRYYWQSSWNNAKPSWLGTVNPDWPGNYQVRYWEKSWQDIIYGNDQSYAKRILDAHFDGVYLDVIDAFELYN
jgi:cysteinyl-tRNA synthetase